MRCIRCNSLIPDGSTFCPVCGAQVSNNPLGDDATRIASPSQPPHRQAAPPPHANYGAPMQQQQYYAPAPKPKNNTVLWVIVGILAAALLGLGGWLLMDTLSDKGDANQPSKDAQVVKASSSVITNFIATGCSTGATDLSTGTATGGSCSPAIESATCLFRRNGCAQGKTQWR